ncbi:hypothetical protein [Pseudophaeobacter sp.]|uniref:hypothetical protein n=1 Tax=Pseudophaeobacter sp. TaxID=1971739 RepID=UPI003299B0FF
MAQLFGAPEIFAASMGETAWEMFDFAILPRAKVNVPNVALGHCAKLLGMELI